MALDYPRWLYKDGVIDGVQKRVENAEQEADAQEEGYFRLGATIGHWNVPIEHVTEPDPGGGASVDVKPAEKPKKKPGRKPKAKPVEPSA